MNACPAQSINGIALKDLEVEYLEIIGEDKSLSPRQNIGFDYGQEKYSALHPYRNTRVTDANGQEMQFIYMVEALNFMAKNGFELVQAYTSRKNEESIYHYILKRKVK